MFRDIEFKNEPSEPGGIMKLIHKMKIVFNITVLEILFSNRKTAK